MHNATTKQRLSALRRKIGFFGGAPRWVRERRARLARLEVRSVEEALERPATDAAAPAAEPTFHPLAAETEHALPAFAPTPAGATELVEAPSPRTEVVVPAPRARPETVPAPAAHQRDRRVARRFALAAALIAAAVGGLAFRAAGPQPEAAPAPSAARGFAGAPLPTALASPAPAAAPASPTARSASAPTASAIEVRGGDTLWHLAAVHLGDPTRWPELHAVNAGQIHDPDLIFPGQQLRLPQPAGDGY